MQGRQRHENERAGADETLTGLEVSAFVTDCSHITKRDDLEIFHEITTLQRSCFAVKFRD